MHAASQGFEEFRAIVHYLLLVGDEAARPVTVDVLDSVVGAQRREELMIARDLELIEKGRQQGRQEGWAQGRAQERAESVLRVLTARGVQVDDKARQRILSCADLVTLERWFDRALTATRLSDVLENPAS